MKIASYALIGYALIVAYICQQIQANFFIMFFGIPFIIGPYLMPLAFFYFLYWLAFRAPNL